MRTRLRHLRTIAVAALVLAAVAGQAQPASSASGSINLSMSITSATSLGACAPSAATQFGTVLPGTTAAPATDCAVSFGSTNDTSMLRMFQTDEAGSAMFAMTDGKLDTGWDGPSGTGNGQFVVPGIWPDVDYGYDQPPVVLQPTTGKVVAMVLDGGSLVVMRFNEDGTLDTTFGGGGTGKLVESSFPHRHSTAIAAAPDGSLFIYDHHDWFWNSYIIKLTPSGVLDTSFDGPSGTGNGIVEIPPSYFDFTYVCQVLVLADGDVLVVGTKLGVSYYEGAIGRITPNGEPDTTFGGGDGYANYDVGSHTYFSDAVEQPDGKIVIGGHEWVGDPDFVAGRILPDGSLDPAFDGPTTPENGLFSIPGIAGDFSGASAVALAPDGDVILAGSTDAGGSTDDTYVMRLQGSTGAYDTAWDGPSGTGNGRARYTLSSGAYDAANELVVAPSGEIFVAGSLTVTGVGQEPMLMKLDEFGRPDTQFDGDSGTSNGIVRVTSTSSDDAIHNLALARDGDLVATVVSETGSPDQFRMIRFDGLTMPDYDDSGLPGDRDWAGGSGFFGVCLRSFGGTGASATWTANATCPQDDTSDHWRAVPPRTGATKVGQIGSGATNGSAAFRFALRAPLDQRAGKYAAPITLEVIAPAV